MFLFLVNFSSSQDSVYNNYYSQEGLYEKRDNLDSLETVFDKHLSKAVELRDTLEQLKVLRWKYWFSSHEIDQRKIIDRLDTISRMLNNNREIAANYYVIASKEYYKGGYQKALALFKESLDKSIAANWKDGIIDNILAINGIYRVKYKYSLSILCI